MNREEALLLLERKELVPSTATPLRGITSIFGMMLAWWIYRIMSWDLDILTWLKFKVKPSGS
ncbi:MAG: hypothetical protein ACNYVW_08310 [Methanosarcinales archaeon]